jgi:hypothetical protein
MRDIDDRRSDRDVTGEPTVDIMVEVQKIVDERALVDGELDALVKRRDALDVKLDAIRDAVNSAVRPPVVESSVPLPVVVPAMRLAPKPSVV